MASAIDDDAVKEYCITKGETATKSLLAWPQPVSSRLRQFDQTGH